MAQLVKNPPAMRETRVQSMGWEDPLEKGKATLTSVLAWRILLIHGVAKSGATERLALTHSGPLSNSEWADSVYQVIP